MENCKEIIQAIEAYCLNQLGVYESRPFGKYPICYRVMGKIFAQFNPEASFFKITLKSEPEKANFYRQLYPEIIVRGYHCPPVQQPYWNTIDLDAFSNMEMLFQMIDEAYDAVVEKFSKKVKTQLLTLTKLEYKDTNGENPDFAMLCDRLDGALNEIVGGKQQRSHYEQYNKRDSIQDVMVVYQEGQPVACGAFKMYDEDHAELKRIYTEPSNRNMGLAAELIRRLEAKAKIKGYKWCILETGRQMEAACHVYKKAGYKIIPNYGQYADMPDSICMERKI
ncbi:hypothetical protein acsn021_19980 [Anaerocolumna cellulosilytica]|uniref:Uncharacterized protein n=1 Tax=Anaerocolumna cellulosilytica TaxID=433286 RepID=A0A6S6QZD9_9FIRM|nr:GNAT family N-acetyltransferase [Anaerocolumna cellulosilytica]MBB5196449.1 putative DNA-binding protein (MmcQ/YjbR family)/GNAT superfamily N-acetyltransferase [Anaerocolumna cellulosilytica]BCJ94429.1 hypothetical protein acsn021_19980 [Anaerocolumna cellulosilytica]